MKIVPQTEAEKMKKKNKIKLPKEIVLAIYGNEFEQINSWIDNSTVNAVDQDHRSAIFHAIFIGSLDMVDFYIRKGADVNMRDHIGWSPLHYASQKYLLEIISLLVDSGAALEAKDDYGNTPLWRATFASEGKGEVIRLLLAKGADPNNSNDYGISPLKLATTIANYDVKQFFK